uniref:Uncharacterized protein n=1 Tax=Ixodes ricinus TaxID=34613 RepID=A0A6B0UYM1_IXORI
MWPRPQTAEASARAKSGPAARSLQPVTGRSYSDVTLARTSVSVLVVRQLDNIIRAVANQRWRAFGQRCVGGGKFSFQLVRGCSYPSVTLAQTNVCPCSGHVVVCQDCLTSGKLVLACVQSTFCRGTEFLPQCVMGCLYPSCNVGTDQCRYSGCVVARHII